ncbi:transglutaminase family protein [Streptosporangiaceae bacterium NEAU-GS5]|nr:transglutaminase family protein [Streptosporangiaceae bacterium NEAU-GS5]
MGWRLKIRHLTTHEYDGEAASSYNEVRMAPLDDPVQNTLERRLTVRPGTPVWSYTDYWGTLVSVFDVPKAHRELTVEAVSQVETSKARPLGKPPSWAELRGIESRLGEFLRPTPRTTVAPEVALAQVPGRDPHEAAEAIAWCVHERVSYVPGSTGVLTSAQEAWNQGQGVCQDMAHVTVALLRAAGIPARYVSGYVHPHRDAAIGEPVVGQSHAWIEYWAGEWVAVDPTNQTHAGEDHVIVARGRDYTDVPPLKGIYQGPPAGRTEVKVEVTRLA